MKTLIVEDDFTNRLLLQAFLSRYGDCHLAVNGEEAVQAFESANVQNSPYDLICMDMLMPGMNGREVVIRLRALEQSRGVLSDAGVKIIMTTAVRDMKEIFASFQALCDAYIFKPIDTGQLLEHLRAFHLVA